MKKTKGREERVGIFLKLKRSWRVNWPIFKRNKSALVGVVIILIFLGFAIFGPIYVGVRGEKVYDPKFGYDPDLEVNPSTGTFAWSPSWDHPMGTTNVGRDIFAQFLSGSRMAFLVGITAALSATIIGLIAGLISGYYGGSLTDSAVLGIIEILMCIPFLPLMLILAMLFGGGGIGIWFLILMMAIIGWSGTARIIRAQTLSLRERPFVDAAKVAGAGDFHVMFKHIAPNVLPLALLNMSIGVAFFILTESTISFLGFGDPTQVSWGVMLNLCWINGHIFNALWWMIPPGIGIAILSTGFYLMARGMEEILNPRLRPR